MVGHEERQTTARDLRALVSAIGFYQLRCVSRSWRTTVDDHLRGTHERIFGVRPLDAKDPSTAAWRASRAPGSGDWSEMPPSGKMGDARGPRRRGRRRPLDQAPPSDALAAPWNAARYDAGTGDLDGSTPVLAAVRRARACLAWRTSLTSFARFGCCGHSTRFIVIARVDRLLRQRRGPALAPRRAPRLHRPGGRDEVRREGGLTERRTGGLETRYLLV